MRVSQNPITKKLRVDMDGPFIWAFDATGRLHTQRVWNVQRGRTESRVGQMEAAMLYASGTSYRGIADVQSVSRQAASIRVGKGAPLAILSLLALRNM